MFKVVKKPKVWLPVAALVIILVVIFSRGGEEKPEFVTALRGDVIEELNVTGTVRAVSRADLAFEKTGRVASLYVSTADPVAAYAILASIVNYDLAADLAKARASLVSTEAKLAELKKGATEEELELDRLKVENARETLRDKLHEAYTKADDAVRNQTDLFISNSNS